MKIFNQTNKWLFSARAGQASPSPKSNRAKKFGSHIAKSLFSRYPTKNKQDYKNGIILANKCLVKK